MSSPEAAFQAALNKFKTRLSKHEVRDFKFSSLKDVQVTILQIQKEQASRMEMMNFTRIQSFLEAMDQWGKIVETFLNTTEFLAFVWGPLKFLLQTASAWAEAFETLLDAYQQLAENMPMLEQYASLFGQHDHMNRILEVMYEDILEFHRKALRIFSKPTWRQLFRSTWKDFRCRFDHILKDLHRHKGLIETQAGLIEFKEAQLHRASVNEAFRRIEKAENERKYFAVRDWLSATNASLDQEAAEDIRSAYPETGKWILEAQLVKLWRKSDIPPRSKMWLHGKPGAGKTILASVIIQDCLKDPAITCAYFYCKNGDRQRNTFVSLAKSIQAQLLNSERDLTALFYDRCFSSEEPALRSPKVCTELLHITLQSLRRTYIVIDGLDECDSKEYKNILSSFNAAVEICNTANPGSLRILYISQAVPEIERMLLTASTLRLDPMDSAKDICSFVECWVSKIQKNFDLTADESNFILNLICDEADGMFLYAKLVVTNLEAQPSQAHLREEVGPNIFPKDIEQAYERIIARLQGGTKCAKQDTEQTEARKLEARKLLGWLVCAKRSLMWHEIQAAISTDTKTQTVDFERRRLTVHIRDLCGSLVDVLPGDRVELVHWTARRCLLDKGIVRDFETDCRLAALCLQYLTFDCFDASLKDADAALERFALQGYFAFQDYAVAHWADHLESFLTSGDEAFRKIAGEDLEELDIAIMEFVGNYAEDLGHETISERDEERNSPFQHRECYQDLLNLLNHIRRHRANGYEAVQKISIENLSKSFFRNRDKLESMMSSLETNSPTMMKLKAIYGVNWFRCTRLQCDYFHEGFPNIKRRDEHLTRHERPFLCSHGSCFGAQSGFTSRQGLEKHIKNMHPPENQVTFEKFKSISPSVTEFRCETCQETFVRKYNLKSHIRTKHSGERPFTCTFCSMAFGRNNDRRRHELIHTGEGKFVCASTMQSSSGATWGCGRSFPRLEALGRHFLSSAGKKCLQHLIDSEMNDEETLTEPDRKVRKLQRDAISKWKMLATEAENGREASPLPLASLEATNERMPVEETEAGDRASPEMDALEDGRSWDLPQNEASSETETLPPEFLEFLKMRGRLDYPKSAFSHPRA